MNEGVDLVEANKRLQWYEKKYGPYINQRGLKNWKNLFRMPTLYEWTILIMLLLTLFVAYAYNLDITTCRQFIDRQISMENNISQIVNERISQYDEFNNNQPNLFQLAPS